MSLTAQPITIHANEVFRRASIDATTATTDYLLTGFTDLDRIIHGLPRGGLTVLAGGPLSCKTIPAANIVEHVAIPETVNPDNQRKPEAVLVFLTGISPRYYALKTMCRLAGLKTSALNEPQLDEATKAKLAKASCRLSTAPIYLCEVRGDDIDDLWRCTSELHAKLLQESGRRLSLVVFDSLQQLFTPHAVSNHAKEQRATVLGNLKALAEELYGSTFALCRPARIAIGNNDKCWSKLLLSNDLEFEYVIERTADVMMTLRVVPEKTPSSSGILQTTKYELGVVNNRTGPMGSVELLFNSV